MHRKVASLLRMQIPEGETQLAAPGSSLLTVTPWSEEALITALNRTFYVFLLLQLSQPWAEKPNPPSDSHFSILDVTIGKTNSRAIQDKLGPAKECHSKRHDGVEFVGYANANEELVFEFGEIGGGDVTGFSVSLPGRTTGCPLSPLPPRVSHLATKGGVRLGLTQQEFVGIFGSPASKTRSGLWTYDWTLEPKYTEGEKKAAISAGHPVPAATYIVGITIEAEFKNGKLSNFYICRLKST
jgi:hypothetical protein